MGFKNGKIRRKKKEVDTETTVVMLILYLLVAVHSILKLQIMLQFAQLFLVCMSPNVSLHLIRVI